MKRPIKSGAVQITQMYEDYYVLDKALRDFRIKYGRNDETETIYTLTSQMRKIMNQIYDFIYDKDRADRESEEAAYDAAFQSYDKEFYNELIRNGYSKEEVEEIASGCHGKEKEDEKKKPVKSSRRVIKSSLYEEDQEKYFDFQSELYNAITDVFKKYNMYEGPQATKEDFDKVLDWMDAHDYWENPEE